MYVTRFLNNLQYHCRESVLSGIITLIFLYYCSTRSLLVLYCVSLQSSCSELENILYYYIIRWLEQAWTMMLAKYFSIQMWLYTEHKPKVVGVLFLKNIFRKSNDYYWSKVYEKWDQSHFVHFEKHPNCSNEMAL